MKRRLFLKACAVAASAAIGCSSESNPSGTSGGGGTAKYDFPVTHGKYTVVALRSDSGNHDRAKQNAEAAISKYPNLNCMVGLYAYNPPTILRAVENAGKLDDIKIVGFDEDIETLKGIEEGKIFGTVVQQPFLFGFKSVEYLSALVRGEEVDVPESKIIYIPHRVIRPDNAAQFKADIEQMMAGKAPAPKLERDDYDTKEPVSLAFLTNTVDPFWDLAEQGVRCAEPIFNASCDVYHPPTASAEEQKRFIERKLNDDCQGLALSPIDKENQQTLINRACEKMKVICHDSDAPETNRLFYIGTGNYLAGRAVGKLVKEAIPDGGEVAIFVGKLEQLNAQERSSGVIDELLDRPIPPEYAIGGDAAAEAAESKSE
ncbi:substrate-binding domain-containing protein [Blastopirellula sp. JC732]|uniref:Substrate-binding domain-containing protein n=1 Tax=Blastopirellula sediminis TaxID=2894196 RepID=A0A9X1MIC1_9BACT|nr:substrate-binding domain-containing protein [Blastopirellula sediminis]MCC9609511.1 substrate-binding domain-containing protein [Blastopirellula sediminis]MCC9627713.1 substrate-binding domain-containing protein [Blastopirellula sediminis]